MNNTFSQDIDNAIKMLEEAIEKLDKSPELYRNKDNCEKVCTLIYTASQFLSNLEEKQTG